MTETRISKYIINNQTVKIMSKKVIYQLIIAVVGLLVGVGTYFNHHAEATTIAIAGVAVIYSAIIFCLAETARYGIFREAEDKFSWRNVLLGVGACVAGSLLTAALV